MPLAELHTPLESASMAADCFNGFEEVKKKLPDSMPFC